MVMKKGSQMCENQVVLCTKVITNLSDTVSLTEWSYDAVDI